MPCQSEADGNSGVHIRSRASELRLWLAIDDSALPIKENLCLYLSKPKVRPEPVLTPGSIESNAPDHLAAMFYGTVLHDEGHFRMWYHACHCGMNPDWPPDITRQFARYKDPVLLGPVCYAESDDGIRWAKPGLQQFKFKGSSNHNAIDLPHGLTAGVNVIKDMDDPDPQRLYKMVYEVFPRYSDPPIKGAGKLSTVVTAVSPDGLRWKVTGIPFVDHFIEQSCLYKHHGKYIISYQAGDAWGSHFSEGGHASGRVGLVRYSYDFDRWSDGFVESFVLPEPRDPKLRGTKGTYDQNHLGVAAASFGNVCVGVYGMWRNAPEFHDISCDFGLTVSNDGLVFHEPVKGHVFFAAGESPAAPHPQRPYHTNLCQGNGILNVGDETRIYHGRWRNTGFHHIEDYYGEIALATLPRDRWGAFGLFPNRDEGWVYSASFEVPKGDCKITLNAEGAQGMSVELADERFRLLPGFSGADAARISQNNGLDIPVTWPGRPLERLAGETVRLKVTFRRGSASEPRLFAVALAFIL
ncbi:MAG: hypothetical protein HY360_04725 [Verrucomicrobia bacterium]|nr:hypothetical protein [Verrucomicrobiota bacterium]